MNGWSTYKERKHTVVPEISNHQSHKPPRPSEMEDNPKHAPASGKKKKKKNTRQ